MPYYSSSYKARRDSRATIRIPPKLKGFMPSTLDFMYNFALNSAQNEDKFCHKMEHRTVSKLNGPFGTNFESLAMCCEFL